MHLTGLNKTDITALTPTPEGSPAMILNQYLTPQAWDSKLTLLDRIPTGTLDWIIELRYITLLNQEQLPNSVREHLFNSENKRKIIDFLKAWYTDPDRFIQVASILTTGYGLDLSTINTLISNNHNNYSVLSTWLRNNWDRDMPSASLHNAAETQLLFPNTKVAAELPNDAFAQVQQDVQKRYTEERHWMLLLGLLSDAAIVWPGRINEFVDRDWIWDNLPTLISKYCARRRVLFIAEEQSYQVDAVAILQMILCDQVELNPFRTEYMGQQDGASNPLPAVTSYSTQS